MTAQLEEGMANLNAQNADEDPIYSFLVEDLCFRLEDLGFQQTIVDNIETDIRMCTRTFYTLVSTLISDTLAFSGEAHPPLDTRAPDRFWRQVYDHLETQGFPQRDILITNMGGKVFARKDPTGELNRMKLVNWLLAEFQAAKILGPQQPEQAGGSSATTNRPGQRPTQMTQSQASVSMSLGVACASMNVKLPIGAPAAVRAVMRKVEQEMSKLPDKGEKYILQPILRSRDFKDRRRAQVLKSINTELSVDYTIRKKMLRQRLHVTMESMCKSSKAQQQIQEIHKGMQERMKSISDTAEFDTWLAYCTHRDIFRNCRITDSVDTSIVNNVRKIKIGKVPDRGGRPDEVRQAAIDAIPFSGFGGRGRGRGRGGRGGRGGGSRGGRGQRAEKLDNRVTWG